MPIIHFLSLSITVLLCKVAYGLAEGEE